MDELLGVLMSDDATLDQLLVCEREIHVHVVYLFRHFMVQHNTKI